MVARHDHLARAPFAQDADGLDHGAGGVDLVVHDEGVAPAHLADDVERLAAVVVAGAALLDDGEGQAEADGHVARALLAAHVRGHDGVVGHALAGEVGAHRVEGVEFVEGHVEEALDLARVQVHGEHAVGPGGLDEVGHEARADGHAGLVLLVAAPVGVEGDDGGDAPRRGAPRGVDHDEQLEDRGAHGGMEGLHEEDVAAADVLAVLDEDVLVGELEDVGAPGRTPQVGADGLREFGVGAPREDRHVHEIGAHRRGLRAALRRSASVARARLARSPPRRAILGP